MDANTLIQMIENYETTFHPDIHFLKEKLKELLENEQYESIPTIHRWIEELIEKHHGIKL